MDLHNIFKSFSFQKMSDFLVVFKQYKTLDFKHYLWTHQHFICWRFSKYLYSQGTSEPKENIFSDGCSLLMYEPNNLIFGNVMIWDNVMNVNIISCNIQMLVMNDVMFHVYSLWWYSIESRQPPDVSAVWFEGVTGWYQSSVYSELAYLTIHWYATIN